jgi:hypothetical protein
MGSTHIKSFPTEVQFCYVPNQHICWVDVITVQTPISGQWASRQNLADFWVVLSILEGIRSSIFVFLGINTQIGASTSFLQKNDLDSVSPLVTLVFSCESQMVVLYCTLKPLLHLTTHNYMSLVIVAHTTKHHQNALTASAITELME